MMNRMVTTNRTGQGQALAELRARREEALASKEKQKTKQTKIIEQNKLALQEAKVRQYREKLKQQDLAKKEKRLNKFRSTVESQNVKGTIPTVESRGVHNMVVYNPFSVPPKDLERDSRTGLLHVKNSIWG